MLRNCDIENCEHTSATMVEKGEIYKKGRTYYVAGAPNDVSFKNSTHTLGVSIHSFPKDVAVAKMDSFRLSTPRRFYSLMSSASCSVPASKTAVTNTYH